MSDILDDAAVAALFGISGERTEQIGLLYQGKNGIERTPTRSSGGTRGAAGTFAIPPGSLRGLFHNHPPRETNRGAHGRDDAQRAAFSGDDTLQARSLGVPTYLQAGDTVLRYDPSTGRVEEVLAQFPTQEWRSDMMRRLLDRAPDDPRGLTR